VKNLNVPWLEGAAWFWDTAQRAFEALTQDEA
jgi:hypothetical protein